MLSLNRRKCPRLPKKNQVEKQKGIYKSEQRKTNEEHGRKKKDEIRVWREGAMREREILGTCIERCRHHQHEAVA